jgi:peptide/nickel transport system permease protein
MPSSTPESHSIDAPKRPSSNSAGQAPSGPPPAHGRTYSKMVWQRFRCDKVALTALLFVVALFFLALLAPFLANSKPILMYVDGSIQAPLVRDFFAPSESPEAMLERIINFLLVFILFGLPGLWLISKVLRKLHVHERGSIMGLCAIVIAIGLSLPFFLTQSRLDASTDYRALAAQVAKDGSGWVIMPPVPYSPYEQFDAYRKPNTTNLMGTDNVGRDVLARVLHGSRVSLSVGFLSVSVACFLGVIVGAVSAYYGGWIDMLLQRIVEIVICFPSFLLILTIMAFLDKRSIFNVMLVIGLTGWTGVSRLVRGQMLAQRRRDYVTAAEALGAKPGRIMFRHLVPNSLAPVLVSATFGIAGAVLTESSLSFLGFGVSPPTASWGELVNQALANPTGYWWLTTFPGLMIFATVTLYNLVGEGARDAMDPRMSL